MTRLPSLTGRQVLAALQRAGFEVVRVSGSHQVLAHRDDPRRRTVVPLHGGRDLARGTLRDIIAQAGLTPAEFLELL